jgi:hypothetical protein
MYKIKIIDTADNFIVGFENQFSLQRKHIIPTLVDLYTEIDISANVYDKFDFEVSLDTKEFITSICGNVVPYSLPFCGGSNRTIKNNQQILDKLIEDIGKMIEFHRVKRFWHSYTMSSNLPEHGTTDAESDAVIANNSTKDGQQSSLDDFYSPILPSGFVKPKPREATIPKSANELKKYIYVMYNNSYDIAVLFQDNYDVIPDIARDFGEWVIVEKFAELPDNTRVVCQDLFHKKTFVTLEELKDKLSSFRSLFGLISMEGGASGGGTGGGTGGGSGNSVADKIVTTTSTATSASEKEKVRKYISENFIVSTDQNKKIKVTDLYKKIYNHLCISYTEEIHFRKRLAGYLLELNLIKKRFSDGYYVYGLDPKPTKQVSSIMSIAQQIVQPISH